MSRKPMIPNTAAADAARFSSSISERNIRYPIKIKSKIAVSVNRASQVHQTPHVGLPQIGALDDRQCGEQNADLRRRMSQNIIPFFSFP